MQQAKYRGVSKLSPLLRKPTSNIPIDNINRNLIKRYAYTRCLITIYRHKSINNSTMNLIFSWN